MNDIKKSDRQQVDRILELFHQLMTKTMELENRPKEFDTGMKLHRAEIHTVQAVSDHPGINMQGLADVMKVTKGAASQMVNKLVSKGLVSKGKAPNNAKEVLLDLTDIGWRGYHAHERFHDAMYGVFRDHYGPGLEEKMESYAPVLEDLIELVALYEERVADI